MDAAGEGWAGNGRKKGDLVQGTDNCGGVNGTNEHWQNEGFAARVARTFGINGAV
jgi:hypothetical protein